MAQTKNSWLNFVSGKMLHVNTTGEGKEFTNVSLSCPQSKTGLATIAVNMGQVLDATNKSGEVVEGYKNILLGSPEKERNVSIATNKKGTSFKTIRMTNAEIATMYADERKAYRAAQAQA